jgi:hypothetical protein
MCIYIHNVKHKNNYFICIHIFIDVRFIRCVGIESVSGLYECAKNTILEVKRYLTNPMQNDINKYENLNKSVEFQNKSVEYGNLNKSVIGGEIVNLSHRKDERHRKDYNRDKEISIIEKDGFEHSVISNRQVCVYIYVYIYICAYHIYIIVYLLILMYLYLYGYLHIFNTVRTLIYLCIHVYHT